MCKETENFQKEINKSEVTHKVVAHWIKEIEI